VAARDSSARFSAKGAHRQRRCAHAGGSRPAARTEPPASTPAGKRYGIKIPKLPKPLKQNPAAHCEKCGAVVAGRRFLCPHCRTVHVTCPVCARTREVTPDNATRLRTRLCRDCWRRATAEEKLAYGGRLPGRRSGRRPPAPGRRRIALKKSSGGVAVACAHCKQVRFMRASEAEDRKTGLCLSCYRLRGAKSRPSEVGRHGRRKRVQEIRQLISEMVSAGGRAELVPGPNQSIWSLKTAVWRARLVAGRSGGSLG
jgi:hypothetical protein